MAGSVAAIPSPITNFTVRYRLSCQTFRDVVWPLVVHKFGPGELVAAEGLDQGRLAKVVDYCGIDYIFRPSTGAAFGLAQRTQRTPLDSDGRPVPWDSFTLNVGTLDRWLAAYRRPLGQLLPAVIVHAYVRAHSAEAVVDAVGIVRTVDLLDYATGHELHHRDGPNGPFVYWTFSELTTAGISVDRFPAPILRDPFAVPPAA